MKIRALICLAVVALLAVAAVAPSMPAYALHGKERIVGKVTDSVLGVPLQHVCITVGPPIRCWTSTNAQGDYVVDLGQIATPNFEADLFYLRTGYVTQNQKRTVLNDSDTRVDVLLVSNTPGQPPPPATQPPNLVQPPVPPALCGAQRSDTPTRTVYLPNITKTLGGPDGFQTPFIVQNIGSAATELEVSFFKFSDGSCVARLTRSGLAAGTSQAYSPNHLTELPADSQFSVVVRSFGANIVAVVNQHQGTGARAEAMSYDGFSSGATTVSLPNVVRRFFGYVTPFIIQNLGTASTTVTARFVSFDGSAPTITTSRTIDAGRSKFVDPNSDDPALGAPGLMDGKQYAVTVTSPVEQVAVVVNTHNDAASVAQPVAYSANGLSLGASTVYGAYAAKNAEGIGRLSTIVVQNLGTAATSPTLTFTPLGGGAVQTFTSPTPVQPGAAWAFDPRFTLGTTTPCSGASATCLGDGEYSFVATSGGAGGIAAVVNVISPATAMGYAATPTPAARFFLPNVTRTLGGASGWTTPILLQTISASGAILRWYRFSDGALVHTQTVTATPGSGMRIDPRSVGALADDTQYAVVIEGSGGTVSAIVVELAANGDNAMIYEGFPQ